MVCSETLYFLAVAVTEENTHLKRLLAEKELEIRALTQVIKKISNPGGKENVDPPIIMGAFFNRHAQSTCCHYKPSLVIASPWHVFFRRQGRGDLQRLLRRSALRNSSK